MGNTTCQQSLNTFGCDNVPHDGAVCLPGDSDDTCSCVGFDQQVPASTGCGIVDFSSTATTLDPKRVEAKGVQYKQGGGSSDFGSDPGSLLYTKFNGTDGMGPQECKAVAKQILNDDPSVQSVYCYEQTGPLGFGMTNGQYISVCRSNCPSLSKTVCYFSTCTLVGEYLDGLPTEASNALSEYSMETGVSNENEGVADTVEETTETLGEGVGVIGEAL